MFRYKKAKETSIRKYRYNKCVYIRAQTLKMVNKRICKEIQESARGNYGLVKSWRPYQLNTYCLGWAVGREQEVKVSESNQRVLPVFC